MSTANQCVLAEYVKRCASNDWRSKDMTTPSNTGNCGEWRINKGRHDIKYQLPPADPEASRNRSSDLSQPPPVLHVHNALPYPVRLQYWDGLSWKRSNQHMIQPKTHSVDSNTHFAHGGRYRVVDSKMQLVREFSLGDASTSDGVHYSVKLTAVTDPPAKQKKTGTASAATSEYNYMAIGGVMLGAAAVYYFLQSK